MRMYKVAKTVVQEVSAEEAIAALREAFDDEPEPESDCPFKTGDIIDIGQCRDSAGQPYTDDDDEPIFLAYVTAVDTSDDTVQICYIASDGTEDDSGTWIDWKHATLVDRKQR